MKKYKVGILGGSGYAGSSLYKILLRHPAFDIEFVSSEKFAGRFVEKILEMIPTGSKLKFESVKDMPYDLDFVFSALPTGVLPKYVQHVLKRTSLIFNISGDFRFTDVETLSQYYPETVPALTPEIVSEYYIPELSNLSGNANIINLPGCMALASIYSVYPLVKFNLIKDSVFVDAKTGSSGAGKSSRETAADRFGNFRLYRAFNHRHLPEIKKLLQPNINNVAFAAYSLDIARGIYASSYSTLLDGVTASDVKAAYKEVYDDKPFVQDLSRSRKVPMLKLVNGTNMAQVKAVVSDDGQVVSVSAIDNLIKGAAGQAVQAANQYFKLDETTGLDQMMGVWP